MQPIIRMIAFSFAVLFWTAQPQAASFTGLGDLPGGDFHSIAQDISADGKVVVGYSDSGGDEAFRWTHGDGMVGLGHFEGGDTSRAYGVSADGAVVVGESDSGADPDLMPFHWTSESGMIDPDTPSFVDDGAAFAVSADGSVVVGTYLGDATKAEQFAYRWTQTSGFVDITLGAATAVSADGSVVAGIDVGAFALPFRWTQSGGFEILSGLGEELGRNSWVNDVSADGVVVVGGKGIKGSDEIEAYRWTELDSVQQLGDLPGGDDDSQAEAASADGSVIVGHARPSQDNSSEAFIWDNANGMRRLAEVLTDVHGIDLDGWTLTSADGISDNGKTIVGTGTNPDGLTEAWIAKLKPDCPLELVLGWSPKGENRLKAMRSYRSRVMHRTRSGRRLSDLYDTHGPELSQILRDNPWLHFRVALTMIKYGPAIDDMIDGNDGRVLRRYELRRLSRLFRALARHASPELRYTLTKLRIQIKSSNGLTLRQIWKRIEHQH